MVGRLGIAHPSLSLPTPTSSLHIFYRGKLTLIVRSTESRQTHPAPLPLPLRVRCADTYTFSNLQRDKILISQRQRQRERESLRTDAVVGMGKAVNQQLPVVQQQQQLRHSSRTFLCQRCAVGLSRFFSFKCALVLMLSLAAFFSALFWVLPFRFKHPGFDAKASIKLSGELLISTCLIEGFQEVML